MADIDNQAEKASIKPKATTDACLEALEMVATRRTDVEAGEMVNEKAPPEIETVDMFKPLPPHHLLPDEQYQLSPRAVLTGWLLGALVHASNIYLEGEMVTNAPQASKLAFQRMAVPLLGGSFGPREHNIIQTVATSTGGMSVLFFSAIPAMYQLGLLTNTRGDFGKMAAVSGSATFFGSALSVPLRQIFVLQFGRERDLVFPSAAAVAISIRQLHLGGKKFFTETIYNRSRFLLLGSDCMDSWKFVRKGYLVGLEYLAFGVIGPIIVAKGLAVGVAYNPKYLKLMTYMSLESPDLISAPSPRYWLMWPAILVMACATFTDVLVN
ncbi:hypothetical protein Neosp_015068 [[Neocosmospora] mangrovei]